MDLRWLLYIVYAVCSLLYVYLFVFLCVWAFNSARLKSMIYLAQNYSNDEENKDDTEDRI